MINNPFVSVIIPNFNHANFLDERIQSILNQTYQNFEIIILDDKSTDNSLEIINKYKDNPHISHIIINEENSGSAFRQWDKGINLTKGDLIWIAESDDSCKPVFLENSVNNFTRFPNLVISYACSNTMNENSEVGSKLQSNIFKHDLFCIGNTFNKKYMYRGTAILNASAVLFKREAGINADKKYINYKSGGDRLFWMEVARQGNVYVMSEPLNYFRHHGNNTTSRCFYDGTSYYEAKDTYDFIKNNYKASLVQQLLIKSFYIEKIRNLTFKDESTKKQLIEYWSPNIAVKSFLFAKKIVSMFVNKMVYTYNSIKNG